MAPAEAAMSFSLLADTTRVDPALASLFSSSSGPVRSHTHRQDVLAGKRKWTESARKAPVSSGTSDGDAQAFSVQSFESGIGNVAKRGDLIEAGISKRKSARKNEVLLSEASEVSGNAHSARKRKRNQDNEQLEDTYLSRLAKEEAADDAKRKRQRSIAAGAENADNEIAQFNGDIPPAEYDDGYEGNDLNLQHETLAPSHTSVSLDKASRTVFLANVSSSAVTSKSAKKTLLTHLSSFLPSLPSTAGPHSIESLRFRSTAFATSIPKKASFARKEINDATTKSTNAYVVYSTITAADAAPEALNGTIALGRHLRVDSVSHPSQVDHRRCVFVGNLGFVDDTSQIDTARAEENDQKPRKKNITPGDVEEGLWVQFSKAGKVESVRVVRDSKTRVGKGFAYVQFADQNGVEAALLFNDKKFPPLLPRKLRVVRAKNPDNLPKLRNAASSAPQRSTRTPRSPNNKPKKAGIDGKRSGASLRGQMKKLLGKAGVSEVPASMNGLNGMKSSKSVIFEGHRASRQGDSNKSLGMRGTGKKKGGAKPRGRSAKRAAAWKAKGAKEKKR